MSNLTCHFKLRNYIVRVLFAFCSMTPVPTTMATLSSSLIDNRQFETDINTSFVDSDSWPGLRVCAAVDGRQCHATVEHVFDMVAVIPTSQIRWDLSRIQLI